MVSYRSVVSLFGVGDEMTDSVTNAKEHLTKMKDLVERYRGRMNEADLEILESGLFDLESMLLADVIILQERLENGL